MAIAFAENTIGKVINIGNNFEISINGLAKKIIDETAFYFPGTKKYLSPTSIEYRYPYIPAYWAGGRGLFLKGTTIGSFKSAIILSRYS